MANVNANINVTVTTQADQIRKLTADIAKLNKQAFAAGSAAAAMQRQHNTALIEGAKASGQFSTRIVPISSAVDRFSASLENNKLSLGQYTRYAASQLPGMRKIFTKEFDMINSVAESRVKRLNTQFISLGQSANGMQQALALTPNALNQFSAKSAIALQRQQIFNRLLRDGSTSLLNWGKNTQWAGRQLMVGFTIPLGIFAGQASKVFRELEAEAINFKKVYGDMFTSDMEVEQNLTAVKELSKELTKYGQTAVQTMKLANTAAQSGFRGAELMAATTEATRLAILGQMEQSQAIKTTIALQTAFQQSSEELAQSINFLNSVENQTILSLEDVSEAIPRVASVIKGFGGDVEDLAVLLVAMKEGGVSAAEGANALKNSMARLISPTKAAKNIAAEYGINLEAIVAKNEGKIVPLFQDLARVLEEIGGQPRQEILSTIFGKFQYARIGTLMQNIARDGSQASTAINLTKSSIEDLASTAEQELSIVENSVSTKFTAAMEKAKIALSPIGEEFLKALTPVIEIVGDFLSKFSEIPGGVKTAIVAVTAIVGGIVPVFLMMVGLIANLIANLGKFAYALKKAGAILRGNGAAFKMYSSAELDAAAASASLEGRVGTLTNSMVLQQGAITTLTGLLNTYVASANAAAAALPTTMGGAAVAARRTGFAAVAPPLPRVYRNEGGPIFDSARQTYVPGTGNRDTVPAMLTPGEFVINKKATQENLPLLNAINSGSSPMGLSKGGQLPGIQYLMRGGISLLLKNISQKRSAKAAGKSTFVHLVRGANTKSEKPKELLEIEKILGVKSRKISGLGLDIDDGFLLNERLRSGSVTGKEFKDAIAKSKNPYGTLSKGGHTQKSIQRVKRAIQEIPNDLVLNDAVLDSYIRSIISPRSSLLSGQGYRLSKDIGIKTLQRLANTGKTAYREFSNGKATRKVAIQLDDGRIFSYETRNISTGGGINQQGGANFRVFNNQEEYQKYTQSRNRTTKQFEPMLLNKGGMIPGVQYFARNMLQRVVQSRKPRELITNPQQQRHIENKMSTWLGGGMERVNIRELAKLGLARTHQEKELFRGMPIKSISDGARPRFSPEIHEAFYRYARTKDPNELSSVIGQPVAMGARSFSTKRKVAEQFAKNSGGSDASFIFKVKNEDGIYGIDPYQRVGRARQSSMFKEQRKSYQKDEREIIPIGGPNKGRPDVIVGRIALDKDGSIVVDTGAKLSKREIAFATKRYDETVATRFTPRQEILDAQKALQSIQNQYLKIKSKGLSASSKEAGDLYTKLNNLERSLLSKKINPETKRDKRSLTRVGSSVRSMSDDLSSIFTRAKSLGMNKGGMIPGYSIGGAIGARASQMLQSGKKKFFDLKTYLSVKDFKNRKQSSIQRSVQSMRDRRKPPPTPQKAGLFGAPLNKGGIARYNAGNIVPGMGNTDSVPAVLTPGEFVVNKKATQNNLPLLSAINDGSIQKFSRGSADGPVNQTGKRYSNPNHKAFLQQIRNAGPKNAFARQYYLSQIAGQAAARATGVSAYGLPAYGHYSSPQGNKSNPTNWRMTGKALPGMPISGVQNTFQEAMRTSPKNQKLFEKYLKQELGEGKKSRKQTAKIMAKMQKGQMLTAKETTIQSKALTSMNKDIEKGVIKPAQMSKQLPNMVKGMVAANTAREAASARLSKMPANYAARVLKRYESMRAAGGPAAPPIKQATPRTLSPQEKKAITNREKLVAKTREKAEAARSRQTSIQREARDIRQANPRLTSAQALQQARANATRGGAGMGTGAKPPGGMMRGMGASMGMAMGGMGVMMLGQRMEQEAMARGETSGMGSTLSTAGIGLSMASILPFLPKAGLIASIAAPIAAAAGGLYLLRKTSDDIARKGQELGSNMGGAANAINEIAKMTGSMTPSQKAAKMKVGITAEDEARLQESEAVQQFVQSEESQKFIDGLSKLTSAERFEKLLSYLQYGIATDIFDLKTAQAFGKTIAVQIEDPALGAAVAQRLTRQKSGSEGVIDLAQQRMERLETIRSRASQQAEVTSMDANKIIGGGLQVIQDFANAEALARDEFREGKISYEELQEVVRKSAEVQNSYTDSIQNALEKTDSLSSTLLGLRDSLIASGLSDEQAGAIEKAGQDVLFKADTNAPGISSLLDPRINAQGPAGLLTAVGNMFALPQRLEATGRQAFSSQDKTLGASFEAFKSGEVSEVNEKRTSQLASLASAMALTPEDIAVFGNLLKENTDLANQFDNLIEEGRSVSQAAQAVVLAQKAKEGQFLTGGPKFAPGEKESMKALLSERVISPNVADRQSEARGMLAKSASVEKRKIEIITELSSKEGIDLMEVEAYLNSLPSFLQIKIGTDLSEMEPEKIQRYLSDAQTLGASVGNELGLAIQNSNAYQQALDAGQSESLIRSIKEAADLGVSETVISYAVRTEGANDPDDLENKIRSLTKSTRAIMELPDEVIKGLGVRLYSPQDIEKFGPLVEKLNPLLPILAELPDDVQEIAISLLLDENGKPKDPKAFTKDAVALNKAYNQLKSGKKEVKKEAIFSLLQMVQDGEGNSLTPEQATAAYDSLVEEYGEGVILNLPPDILSKIIVISSEIQGLAEEKARIEAILAGNLVDSSDRGLYVQRLTAISQLMNIKSGEIAGEVGRGKVRGGDKGGNGGGSGGGGGEKSIIEQLKEQLKQAKAMYKFISKITKDMAPAFKGFISGPFAAEFIEYLKGQGEKAIKELSKSAKKFKEAYKAFLAEQRILAKQAAAIFPVQLANQFKQAKSENFFKQYFASQGITGEDMQQEIMSLLGPQASFAMSALNKKESGKKLGGAEQKALDLLNKLISPENVELMKKIADEARRAERNLAQAQAYFISMGMSDDVAQALANAGYNAENFAAALASGDEQAQNILNHFKEMEKINLQQGMSATLRDMGNEADSAAHILAQMPDISDEARETLMGLGNASTLTGDQIRKFGNDFDAARAKLEKFKTASQQLEEQIDATGDAIRAAIEKINRLEIRPLELNMDAINKVIAGFEKQIRALQKSKKPFENQIKAIEKEIKAYNDQIKNLQKSQKAIEDQVELLKEKEKEIQEEYDKRIKALDKIEKANKRLIAMQKAQLSVSQAISEGDIYAATRAVQEARAEMASLAQEESREAIDKDFENRRKVILDEIEAKEKDIKFINEQIEAIQERIEERQERIEEIRERILAIDEQIEAIQDQIAEQQERILEIQEAIAAAKQKQLELEEKIYALETLRAAREAKKKMDDAVRRGDRGESLEYAEAYNIYSEILASLDLSGLPQELQDLIKGQFDKIDLSDVEAQVNASQARIDAVNEQAWNNLAKAFQIKGGQSIEGIAAILTKLGEQQEKIPTKFQNILDGIKSGTITTMDELQSALEANQSNLSEFFAELIKAGTTESIDTVAEVGSKKGAAKIEIETKKVVKSFQDLNIALTKINTQMNRGVRILTAGMTRLGTFFGIGGSEEEGEGEDGGSGGGIFAALENLLDTTQLDIQPINTVIQQIADLFIEFLSPLSSVLSYFVGSEGLPKVLNDTLGAFATNLTEAFNGFATQMDTILNEIVLEWNPNPITIEFNGSHPEFGDFSVGASAEIPEARVSPPVATRKLNRAAGGIIPDYSFGEVFGDGGRDLIPAMLTPGEFVIRKSMVEKYGQGLFESLNQGAFSMPTYRVKGASPTSVRTSVNSANINAPVYNTYDMKFAINGTDANPEDIANQVMIKMKQLQNMQIRSNRGY